MRTREGFEAKQEGDTFIIEKLISKAAPSTSRQWSAFRNPRIVRVSRTFGGKDRHSKVCTVRGLRDRRIRLSVTTAIQLYDLQDKLGVSQPSKVIDWLLEATKNDIDMLPPLQFPQSFAQFHHQTLLPHHESSAASFYGANSTFLKDGESQNLLPKSSFWDRESNERGSMFEKGKWVKTNEHEGEDIGISSSQILAQKLFPMGTHSTPLPLMLNNAITYNYPYHNSDPSSLSLSHFGTSHGLFPSSHQADPHSCSGNGLQFPSGSQLFFCPPSAAASSLSAPCAPYNIKISSAESDSRVPFNQIHQFLSSTPQALTQPLIPPFSSKLLGLDNNSRSKADKDSARA
ncbi:hypothetical protein L6164_011258 [Bauhinia variegata]|uniref:Uncharacterized protein n=1 Tax=Bauhinia variegata TaxID=167791 RepID=A0ACB9P596_BAUVA|nr:hypothetical protein L6164_011258 [Bauhinia variegata]